MRSMRVMSECRSRCHSAATLRPVTQFKTTPSRPLVVGECGIYEWQLCVDLVDAVGKHAQWRNCV